MVWWWFGGFRRNIGGVSAIVKLLINRDLFQRNPEKSGKKGL